MSDPVFAQAANPIRVARWSLILLGVVCLGIGVLYATAATVDLDFIDRNHLKTWPHQVLTEMSIAIIMMGFGPWCLLRGMRSPVRQR
jgi:H+/Cl- antiporter ClcA